MAADIDSVIADLQTKLADQEAEVIKSKELINLLCSQYGRNPIYPDTELDQSSSTTSFAPDEFYGQSLSGSMRKILEQRKSTGLGPATPREIYDVLVDGGYAFDTENEQNRLTGIRVSLRKSSMIFHRLPDGKRYGLLDWYPKAKRRQHREDNQAGGDNGAGSSVSEVDNEDEETEDFLK